MNSTKDFRIQAYKFKSSLIAEIRPNFQVDLLWPQVYILLNDKGRMCAYVGESTDVMTRMSTHLKDEFKKNLTKIFLISSDKFNKSATLDIESNLIKYLVGDGQYKLLNGTLGLANHSYYQKDEYYWGVFEEIWEKLRFEHKIVKNSLIRITNTDLFKYSPYKSLTKDQKSNIIEIIKGLLENKITDIVAEGAAGTGKTILATFLFKLLKTDIEGLNFNEYELEENNYIEWIKRLKDKYPDPSMALVIPMASFRDTMKKVFRNIEGLNANMVIGPSEAARNENKYDILIVDEADRLRRRRNLGNYFKKFDDACEILKVDKLTSNELDWVTKQAFKRVILYDETQSVRPSDVRKINFEELKKGEKTVLIPLKSQFRVKGGNNYISFVENLLNCKLQKATGPFLPENYELLLFDSLHEMHERIKRRDEGFGLSRLMAGYAWEWVSQKNESSFDIETNDAKLRWNSVKLDWVNSKNAVNEVGCIHTTQGYDLNYAGVIFGPEISYDKVKKELVIIRKNYKDKYGKHSDETESDLKNYIKNIYKTLLLRGIEGTYVYAYEESLKEYFKKHIATFKKENSIKIAPWNKTNPFVTSIPFYDIRVAAGEFSEPQQASECEWLELPPHIKASKDYFACKIHGESMNKRIPNGSLCLFRKDSGGTREGEIVLVQHHKIQDTDFGSGYTVKLYHSEKEVTEDGWFHTSIVLKPMSDDPNCSEIKLNQDELEYLKVVGIFEAILQ